MPAVKVEVVLTDAAMTNMQSAAVVVMAVETRSVAPDATGLLPLTCMGELMEAPLYSMT